MKVSPWKYQCGVARILSRRVETWQSLYGSQAGGTMWGEEQALAMLREAGFEGIEIARLPHDLQNSYYLARKR
ncbi:MAG: hypothetical protein ACREXU_00225 [Gammaproteobacteria bacterium]